MDINEKLPNGYTRGELADLYAARGFADDAERAEYGALSRDFSQNWRAEYVEEGRPGAELRPSDGKDARPGHIFKGLYVNPTIPGAFRSDADAGRYLELRDKAQFEREARAIRGD